MPGLQPRCTHLPWPGAAWAQVCRARKGAGHSDADHTFEVPYDVLLLAVGGPAHFAQPPLAPTVELGRCCWLMCDAAEQAVCSSRAGPEGAATRSCRCVQ